MFLKLGDNIVTSFIIAVMVKKKTDCKSEG